LLLVAGVFALSDSIRAAFTGGADCIASPGSCEDSPGGGGGAGGGSGGSGGGSGGGGGPTTTNPPGPTSTTVP
jgi:hypothetical protein